MALLLNLRRQGVRMMKEGGWIVVLCASFGFQRGDCISTLRLGRTSTQFEVGDRISTPQIGEGENATVSPMIVIDNGCIQWYPLQTSICIGLQLAFSKVNQGTTFLGIFHLERPFSVDNPNGYVYKDCSHQLSTTKYVEMFISLYILLSL